MRKLTHQEILSLRKNNAKNPRFPISFLLNDIRSFHNVGTLFRIADGIRAEKIYLCGITGKPPDKAITKTALGAEDSVPWEYVHDAVLLSKRLKESGVQLIAMEQTDESQNCSDAHIQYPCCLVVGNEVAGVDSAIIDLCDLAVDVPMEGEKNSLNVGIATAVAAYELSKKFKQTPKCAQFP